MNHTTDDTDHDLNALLSYKEELDGEAFYQELLIQIQAHKQRKFWVLCLAFVLALGLAIFMKPQEFTFASQIFEFITSFSLSGANIPFQQIALTATFALIAVSAAFTMEKM